MPESATPESIIATVLKRKVWLIGSVILWLIAAAIYLATRTPLYEATALLQAPASSFDSETDLYTAAEKFRRLPLYKTVLKELHGFDTAEAFQKATAVRVIPRTALIRLSVKHRDKSIAEILASRLESAARISDDKKQEASKNFRSGGLVLLDPIYSTGPVNPPPVLVLAAALACGLVTGLGMICLRQSI